MVMKRLIVFVMLFVLTAPASAFDKWDKPDIALATASLAVHAMDWRQTRHIAENPDKYYETNPVLGNHPSKGEVDVYFATTALAQIAIAHCLPSVYRKSWLGVMIGIGGASIYENCRIGIGMRW